MSKEFSSIQVLIANICCYFVTQGTLWQKKVFGLDVIFALFKLNDKKNKLPSRYQTPLLFHLLTAVMNFLLNYS
jgi:hypothetical protein